MTSLLDEAKTVLIEVETSAVAEIKTIVGDVKEFVLTEAQKAVAWLKTAAEAEPLVTKTLNLISLASTTGVSGAEKMANVVNAIKDIVDTFVAEGGFKGLLAKAVNLARQFAQSLYDDLKSGLFAHLGINLA